MKVSPRGGFSVIELLIVLTLVGVALLPLAGIQFGSRQDVVESNRHAQALDFATNMLETMRADGFGNVDASSGVDGNYGFVTQVINLSPNLEEYRVTVTWQDGQDARVLTLSALQADRR